MARVQSSPVLMGVARPVIEQRMLRWSPPIYLAGCESVEWLSGRTGAGFPIWFSRRVGSLKALVKLLMSHLGRSCTQAMVTL